LCFKICISSGTGWWTSVIPALGRLRQEDHDIQASQGYIVRLCLKKLLFYYY
jgi:hypothetical protein